MRVVVTGGAGFIGSNLCAQLLATDGIDSVAVIDDLSNGNLANLDGLDPDRLTFVERTILDDDALDRAFAAADARTGSTR